MNKLNDLLLQAQAKVQNREEGQGVIEYVLVVAVISIALFTAFVTTGIETAIGGAVTDIVATF